MDFEILIIGSDINAYTMARNCHELYHQKVHLIAKEKLGFTNYSSITDIMYEPNLWDKKVFRKVLKEYAEKIDKKILLIATNDTYVRLIVENKDYLKKWYMFNYPSLEIMNNLLVKDKFYSTYGKRLNIPKTFIYSCKDKNKWPNDFTYPMILKPSDGVNYYKHKFPNQSKVYKIKSEEELKNVIKTIEDSGYDGNLILQEFVLGDDSYLCDCMMYANSKGKVEFATFAQIGLQEHTNTGVGNCTVLINGYNQFGKYDDIVKELKDFLEEIKYTGMAEFDLKYDKREQKYKVFEINPRQARCSYYLTATGHNPIEYLVDDLVYHKSKKFVLEKKQILLSFVPKSVIKKYVLNSEYKKKALELLKAKKAVFPLNYPGDKSLLRKAYLIVRDQNYRKKYKEDSWENLHL